MFLFWSPDTPTLPPPPPLPAFPARPVSALLTFLLGFLFSLANIDCLATRDILCCFGELEPAIAVTVAAVEAVAGVVLAVEGLDTEEGLDLAVAVINSPAAVFLEEAELVVLVDAGVMVVLALVIFGTEGVTEDSTVLGTDLTLLAKVEVILAPDLALSSDFSLLQDTPPGGAAWDLAVVEAVGAV